MSELNQTNIKQIYKDYFELIDSFFGSIKHYLGEEKDSHINLGISMASYPWISDLIVDAIEDLDQEIENFWSENAKKVFDYVKTQDTLKCLYSGAVSPEILEDFIKKSSLYVDSVIIADPIYNLSIFQKQIILDKKYYLNKLIRHVFNIWKLKDLILADTKENIIFILPINLHLLNTNDKKDLLNNANDKFTGFVNSITNQKFSTANDSLLFLQEFQTNNNLYNEIKNPQLLPPSFQDEKSLTKFLSNFRESGKYSQIGLKSIGWNFGLYLQSQFIRVQEHKLFCDSLLAEPIYDYELPWFFFNHEVGGSWIDGAIINSLQKETFEWISKVPISAIQVLRSENKLEYMRSLLRKSITDLKAKNDKDLIVVSHQIEENFQEAFKQQNFEIKDLEKEVWNIIKKDIPIVTGGFLAGFVPYLWTAISIATAFTDIKNLFERRKKAKNEISSKKSNFINLLMKSHDEK